MCSVRTLCDERMQHLGAALLVSTGQGVVGTVWEGFVTGIIGYKTVKQCVQMYVCGLCTHSAVQPVQHVKHLYRSAAGTAPD